MTEIRTIAGNGNMITTENTVLPFDKINLGGVAGVRFHACEEYRADVTVDSNLIDNVEIKSENDKLIIQQKNLYPCSYTKLVVDVYCPTLTGITINGCGNFESVDKIITPTFSLNISGSGNIEGEIECENFSAWIAGSGRVNMNGNSKDSNINISGTGNFDGNEFKMNNAYINISGCGNVNVCVSDKLNANISGIGGICYRGDPKIDSIISGIGKVRKM